MFGLSNLFSSLLTYQTVMCLMYPTESRGRWGAFLIGLGLTNQHTLIFFALPYVAFIILAHPIYRSPKMFLQLMICGLIGLLPYAYLPWASQYKVVYFLISNLN